MESREEWRHAIWHGEILGGGFSRQIAKWLGRRSRLSHGTTLRKSARSATMNVC